MGQEGSRSSHMCAAHFIYFYMFFSVSACTLKDLSRPDNHVKQ